MLQLEYEFSLPVGYVDEDGNLHRDGVMRLATARDQIDPLGDHRVRANSAYLSILLLARVITQLGRFSPLPPERVEGLFSADFGYLQEMYLRINSDGNVDGGINGDAVIETECPSCGARFLLDMADADPVVEEEDDADGDFFREHPGTGSVMAAG